MTPHPDLAKTYLDMCPRESHADRLARARTLAKLAPRDPESRMMLANAAIAACDYKTARETMLPLIQGDERPTARMCLIMAELEDAEHGETGFARDWFARATRAPRDAAWIAGGVMSDHWLPALPATGKIDAFVWRRPDEYLSTSAEAEEAIFRPVLRPAEPPVLIEKPRVAITAQELENQAGPVPDAARLATHDIASEGVGAEPLPEAENGPMASQGSSPEVPSKPQNPRSLF